MSKEKLLPLVKAAHAGALDGGDVDEHIRAARVLHDEAVALLGVESQTYLKFQDWPI